MRSFVIAAFTVLAGMSMSLSAQAATKHAHHAHSHHSHHSHHASHAKHKA
jgi:hypothetical protein